MAVRTSAQKLRYKIRWVFCCSGVIPGATVGKAVKSTVQCSFTGGTCIGQNLTLRTNEAGVRGGVRGDYIHPQAISICDCLQTDVIPPSLRLLHFVHVLPATVSNLTARWSRNVATLCNTVLQASCAKRLIV